MLYKSFPKTVSQRRSQQSFRYATSRKIRNVVAPDGFRPDKSWLSCKADVQNCNCPQIEVLHGWLSMSICFFSLSRKIRNVVASERKRLTASIHATPHAAVSCLVNLHWSSPTFRGCL